MFQELSLNSPSSASAPYSETDAAEAGSSGRMMTDVTVSANNASSRLFSWGTRPPCEWKTGNGDESMDFGLWRNSLA